MVLDFIFKYLDCKCLTVLALVFVKNFLYRVGEQVQCRLVMLEAVSDDMSDFISEEKNLGNIALRLKIGDDILHNISESVLKQSQLLCPQSPSELPK
jgi:hypothetical protein